MPSPDPSESVESERRPPDEEEPALASLRSATDADAAFVAELGRDAFLVYGSYDDFLGEWFRDPSVTTVLAETAGAPAGFVMVTFYPDPDSPRDRVADLVAIAVRPGLRNRGIGTQLLEAALDLAESADPPAREMWLVVAEGNARAERLFARQGFRRGAGVGVYPAGQRAHRMVKSIAKEGT